MKEIKQAQHKAVHIALHGTNKEMEQHIIDVYDQTLETQALALEEMKKSFSLSTFVAEIRDKWGNEFDDVIEEMAERSQSEYEYYNQALQQAADHLRAQKIPGDKSC